MLKANVHFVTCPISARVVIKYDALKILFDHGIRVFLNLNFICTCLSYVIQILIKKNIFNGFSNFHFDFNFKRF